MIQFELYRLLVNRGFLVYPEYRQAKDKDHLRGSRFDLVIHDGKAIQLIIESKSQRTFKSWSESNQCKCYSAFGLPILYVTAADDLNRVVAHIANLFPLLANRKGG